MTSFGVQPKLMRKEKPFKVHLFMPNVKTAARMIDTQIKLKIQDLKLLV